MSDEYISRKAVETFLRSRNYCLDTEADIEYVVECLSKEIPAADVRPVVYCVDCRYWVKQKASVQGYCKLSGRYPSGGWWCADGDRREGGTP